MSISEGGRPLAHGTNEPDSQTESGAPLVLRVIGHVQTPFAKADGTPVQSVFAQGAEGTVTVNPSFAEALDDLEGFERIWLLTWLDRADDFRAKVVPYRDTLERGLFATRAPCRPNPIGLSVVRLLGRDGNVLRVADVDLLDGTPVLDIKPYVPVVDAHPSARAGWYDKSSEDRRLADGRFHLEDRGGAGTRR
jgi:tRNA (adenine37-N6)-methyltransferase